jgi:Domain of Unknown Function (DUF1080)
MNCPFAIPAIKACFALKYTLLCFAVGSLTLGAGCVTRRAPDAPPVAPKGAPAAVATNAVTASAPKPTASVPNASSSPSAVAPAGTQVLFEGKTLKGWAITDFAGHGEVKVEDGKLLLEMGVMTGVTYTNPIPKTNYEIELDAMRVEGSDFFCGLTFPIGDNPCSFILGGWGGGVVGLSSIDSEDAAHNETSKFLNFDKGRWYHVRLRVTPAKIEAWIDKDKMVDLPTQDRSFSIRIEMELSKPLGIATWSTTGAIKNVWLRKL